MYVKPKWKFWSLFPSILFHNTKNCCVYIWGSMPEITNVNLSGHGIINMFLLALVFLFKLKLFSYNVKSWPIIFEAHFYFCQGTKLLDSHLKNIYGKSHWFIWTNCTNLCTNLFLNSTRTLDVRQNVINSEPISVIYSLWTKTILFVVKSLRKLRLRRYIIRLLQHEKFYP